MNPTMASQECSPSHGQNPLFSFCHSSASGRAVDFTARKKRSPKLQAASDPIEPCN